MRAIIMTINRKQKGKSAKSEQTQDVDAVDRRCLELVCLLISQMMIKGLGMRCFKCRLACVTRMAKV